MAGWLTGAMLVWLASNGPVKFHSNKGQSDAAVRFIAHGDDFSVYLTRNTARLVLTHEGRDPAQLSMIFDGALAARLVGDTGSPEGGFNKVQGESLYPGIDVMYAPDRAQVLSFLLNVHPKAQAGRVALRFEGASSVQVDASGALVAELGDGQLVRVGAPVAYQQLGKTRTPVKVRYIFDAERRVRLLLGRYDPNKPVIIRAR